MLKGLESYLEQFIVGKIKIKVDISDGLML